MADITTSVVNYKAYNVVEGDSLQGEVSRIIGVMLPKGFVAAGFSNRGDLLMIRYSDYARDMPEWVPDFFDHRFAEEPLLMKPEHVVALYILTDKYMLVPADMFDMSSAEQWMRKVFYIEDNDDFDQYTAPEDKAQYVYAWPSAIKGLAHRYFVNARLLPLAACQLAAPYRSENSIQCCITSTQVIATFHKQKKLQWHQVFSYSNAEEIAYRFMQVCNEYGMDPEQLDVLYTVTHNGLHRVIEDLSRYIPNFAKAEAGVMVTNPDWAATVSLFQRLYTCAL